MDDARFPKSFGADVVVTEIDLDVEEVHVGGERLTEERAERMATARVDEVPVLDA
ncbi:MAG: hypothetical protein Q4F65_12750 [Propionibacteriaceae bacterium]|nr:hypothetical protein [Propionibacteriaceae bacterium]